MIIWKIGFTLDFGNISLIQVFGVPPHGTAGRHLPYLNIKIRKLNIPN